MLWYNWISNLRYMMNDVFPCRFPRVLDSREVRLNRWGVWNFLVEIATFAMERRHAWNPNNGISGIQGLLVIHEYTYHSASWWCVWNYIISHIICQYIYIYILIHFTLYAVYLIFFPSYRYAIWTVNPHPSLMESWVSRGWLTLGNGLTTDNWDKEAAVKSWMVDLRHRWCQKCNEHEKIWKIISQ